MAQYYVGVDVGGTTVKMGMFSDTGELLDKWEIPTRRKNNGKYILSDIVDSIEEKRETFEGNIKGIGVGIPGPVTADGTVLKCANLGWEYSRFPQTGKINRRWQCKSWKRCECSCAWRDVERRWQRL